MGGGEPSSPVFPAPPLRVGAPRAALSASRFRQVKRHKAHYTAPQIGTCLTSFSPQSPSFQGVSASSPNWPFPFPFSFPGGGGHRSGQIFWSPRRMEGTLLPLPRPQLEGGGEVSRVHKGQMLKKKRGKVSTHPIPPLPTPRERGTALRTFLRSKRVFLKDLRYANHKLSTGCLHRKGVSFPVSHGNCSSLPNFGDEGCYLRRHKGH